MGILVDILRHHFADLESSLRSLFHLCELSESADDPPPLPGVFPLLLVAGGIHSKPGGLLVFTSSVCVCVCVQGAVY